MARLRLVVANADGTAGVEVGSASRDGDTVTFEGAVVADLFATVARRLGSDTAAWDVLARDGWSNGYLMLLPDEDAPVAAAAATADPQPSLDPAHQQAWQDALASLQADWPDLSQPMVDDLAAQAGDDVENDRLADLGALAVSAVVVAGLAAAIGAAMLALAGLGAKHVVTEAKAQGKKITAPADVGADQIDQVAQAIAGVLANGYASAAARKALQVAGPNATAADIETAVRQTLTDMGTSRSGWVADNLRSALSVAQSAGRWAAFEAHPPKILVSIEHAKDGNQCLPCTEVNGSHFGSVTEARAAYPVSGYVGCLGGADRCRGHVAGLW